MDDDPAKSCATSPTAFLFNHVQGSPLVYRGKITSDASVLGKTYPRVLPAGKTIPPGMWDFLLSFEKHFLIIYLI